MSIRFDHRGTAFLLQPNRFCDVVEPLSIGLRFEGILDESEPDDKAPVLPNHRKCGVQRRAVAPGLAADVVWTTSQPMSLRRIVSRDIFEHLSESKARCRGAAFPSCKENESVELFESEIID